MAEARYWRVSRIEPYLYESGLVLSEVALYNGATRVDGSAMLSATVAPISGSLTALGDSDFGTRTTWAAESLFLPGFALVFDFGTPQPVTKVGVAGPSRNSFAHKFALEYSSDGAVWTELLQTFPASKWVDAATMFEIAETVPGDPNYTDVVLLANFNGVDGSTTFTDISSIPKLMTAVGNAQISTAQSKFGGASLLLDGTGDYVELANQPDFRLVTGDFTIECFVRITSFASGTFQAIICQRNGSTLGWGLFVSNLGAVFIQGNDTFALSANGLVLLNTWHHLAVTRSGTTVRVFVDGVVVATSNSVPISADTTSPMRIGAQNIINSYFVTGNIDSVRLTASVARYTANFTPPSVEFADGSENSDATPLRGNRAPVQALISEYEPPAFGVSESQPTPGLFDMEDGGDFQIVGTVKEVALPANTPLARRVALYEERSGRLIKRGFSDNAGNYAFTELRGDRPYTVIAFDHTDTYRAVVADKLNAEPMP